MHTGLRRPLSLTKPARSPRRAFTLLEALIAVTLTLMLMGMVVTAFGMITTSVNDSRATIGINDKLRAVKHTLISDLSGVTVTMLPPRNPENGEGYFVYKEGVANISWTTMDQDGDGAVDDKDGDGDNTDDPNDYDYTLGDSDDVLLFTTRKTGDTFAGFGPGSAVIESPIGEVAYFVRGTTLYRRVLLVAPGVGVLTVPASQSYYGTFDISARMRGGERDGSNPLDRTQLASPYTVSIVPNTLSDLTKPENRFAHQPYAYPHSIDFWDVLGLPTLRETSSPDWPLPEANGLATSQYETPTGGDAYTRIIRPMGSNGTTLMPYTSATRFLNPTAPLAFDPWVRPLPWNETDDTLGTITHYGTNATRGQEDVLLTNVLAFDVKAYDPGAPMVSPATGTGLLVPGDVGYNVANTIQSYGAYADLGYATGYTPAAGAPASPFSGDGGLNVNGTEYGNSIYDTWSTHFESDGVNNDQVTTGGVAADPKVANPTGEAEAPAPYPAPLRGIQIRIRAFEPDSRQIRQVTIVHDFLPQ